MLSQAPREMATWGVIKTSRRRTKANNQQTPGHSLLLGGTEGDADGRGSRDSTDDGTTTAPTDTPSTCADLTSPRRGGLRRNQDDARGSRPGTEPTRKAGLHPLQPRGAKTWPFQNFPLVSPLCGSRSKGNKLTHSDDK